MTALHAGTAELPPILPRTRRQPRTSAGRRRTTAGERLEPCGVPIHHAWCVLRARADAGAFVVDPGVRNGRILARLFDPQTRHESGNRRAAHRRRSEIFRVDAARQAETQDARSPSRPPRRCRQRCALSRAPAVKLRPGRRRHRSRARRAARILFGDLRPHHDLAGCVLPCRCRSWAVCGACPPDGRATSPLLRARNFFTITDPHGSAPRTGRHQVDRGCSTADVGDPTWWRFTG